MIMLDLEKAEKQSIALIKEARKRQFIEKYMRFTDIETLPTWAKPGVETALEKGYIEEPFNLTYNEIQAFYILFKLGLFD